MQTLLGNENESQGVEVLCWQLTAQAMISHIVRLDNIGCVG